MRQIVKFGDKVPEYTRKEAAVILVAFGLPALFFAVLVIVWLALSV